MLRIRLLDLLFARAICTLIPILVGDRGVILLDEVDIEDQGVQDDLGDVGHDQEHLEDVVLLVRVIVEEALQGLGHNHCVVDYPHSQQYKHEHKE